MALSAGSVSLGVHGDAAGFGSQLTSDIMGMGGLFSGLGKHMGGLIVAGMGAIGIGMSIAAVFKAGVDEYKTADSLNAQFAAGIKSTGNAANLSVQGMNDLAESIINYSGQTDESIGKTEQLLQTFTNIRNVGPNKIFDMATIAAADMAAKMGGDASSEAIKLGRALQDPVKGVTALTRVGVVFTKAQKDQITALMKSGDVIGAQKIILGELTTEFGGAAKAAGQTLPGMIERGTRAFDEMSKAIVGGVVPLALPAIQWITQAMKDAGPWAQEFSANVGEKLAAAIRVSKPVMSDMGKFISETLVPDLKSISTWITDKGVPGVRSFVQWVKDNQTALEVLGTVITAALLPVFADIAVAWVTAKVNAVESAAAQFAAHYTVVAGWLMSAGAAVTYAAGEVGAWISLRVEAATSAAAEFASHTLAGEGWLGHAATAVLAVPGIIESWIALKWEAITSAASEVASHALGSEGWIAHAATAVVSALADAGAWISLRREAAVSAASELASHAFGKAGWIAGAIAAVTSAGVQIGAWIATSDTAMASGIRMAAAWVIGLGPIAWVIAGIAALVAAFVWAYDNIGWFKDGVDWMTKSVGTAFTSMWNYVIQPVLTFLIGGLVGVMTTFGDMLVTLGQVPGFGWAKDAGNKILDAAGAVRGFAADIKKIPADVPVSINVTANYSAAVATVLGGARAAVKLAGFAEGGTILPTPGGTIVRVAEAGRKETIVDTASLNAAMAQKQKSTNEGGTVIHNWYVTGETPEAIYAQFVRRQNALVV